MSSGEWIQISVAAVLTFTLIGVLWYAREARRQAAASVRMAEEMREQRLGEDRPHLLIDLKETGPAMAEVDFEKKETILDSCPLSLELKIQNVGRGPAKDVVATAVHHRRVFYIERRGYLLRGESWEFHLSLAVLFGSMLDSCPPRALKDWLADRQIYPQTPIRSPLGVVVEYWDIHERAWVAYLELEYESELDDETDRPIWWVEPGKQCTTGPLPLEGS